MEVSSETSDDPGQFHIGNTNVVPDNLSDITTKGSVHVVEYHANSIEYTCILQYHIPLYQSLHGYIRISLKGYA